MFVNILIGLIKAVIILLVWFLWFAFMDNSKLGNFLVEKYNTLCILVSLISLCSISSAIMFL